MDRLEIEQFAEQPLLAILTTVNADGSPQSTPVWYLYDGERFKVTSRGDRVKVRNIRHNRNVALCITDTTRQVRSLTVRGYAEVIHDDQASQRLHRQLSIRYLGEQEGQEWADSMAAEEMVIVRITPEHFLWTG